VLVNNGAQIKQISGSVQPQRRCLDHLVCSLCRGVVWRPGR